MVTMVLGGLWHGANWTFVVWGTLHGAYLVVNHGWRAWRGPRAPTRAGRIASTAFTFVAVVVAWVFFRAESVQTAASILGSMAGMNGLGSSSGFRQNVLWLGACAAIVWALPNTQEFMGRRIAPTQFAPSGLIERFPALAWEPSLPWLAAILVLGLVSLANLNRVSEFLYFQF
jgi:hypothetical protein